MRTSKSFLNFGIAKFNIFASINFIFISTRSGARWEVVFYDQITSGRKVQIMIAFFLKQFGSTLPAILTRLLTKDKKDCFFNIHSVFNFIFIKKNGNQSAFITVYLLVVM